MESELGCRYSVLLELPYFDAPTMLVIDPMHCLFLGLAKLFLKKVLIGRGILSNTDLATIQKRVNAMKVPSDIGRIPHKIEHAFYNFSADQYKNWVMHYSIICLHGMLSSEHLECWRHFVLACRYICQPVLKPEDVRIADALLLKFCSRTELLFGKDVITPNMHMSCHLRECILDYGPLNHFWLFAFERFNGILGQLPNNNKSIETQMMKHFIADTEIFRVPIPTEFKDDFEWLYDQMRSIVVGTPGYTKYFSFFLEYRILIFFRTVYNPFCIHPKVSVIQALAMDYLVAAYPLTLVAVTYVLVTLHTRNCWFLTKIWKPFRHIMRPILRNFNIQTSLIDSFAALFLLSSIKFQSVSSDILLPTRLYDINGSPNSKTYLYLAGDVEYFGSTHMPFAIIALVVLSMCVILPTLLLFLYPCRCFQQLLNRLHCNFHVLRVFMDIFLGKDGTDNS